MKPHAKLYALLSHHPTSCTTGFTPRPSLPASGFVAGTHESGRLPLRLHEISPPRTGSSRDALAGRRASGCSGLHLRALVCRGLHRQRAASRRACRASIVVRTDRRPAMHASEHARQLHSHPCASRHELGSTDSMGRASPHGQPTGSPRRRRTADRVLAQSRTTSSLAPAAFIGRSSRHLVCSFER